MYTKLGISPEVRALGKEAEAALSERFQEIDENADYNQLKVLYAMQKNGLQEGHFAATTGYGYNDVGREALERIYADIFHTEAALVRPQITCGTHALTIALFASVRPGDEILSPVGRPYDTLEEVIGIRQSPGSLREWGVSYREVPLLPDGSFDYEGIKKAVTEKTKLVEIQRSKGYSDRKSFSVQEIGTLISFMRSLKNDLVFMVDNCYGEFVERVEPSDLGADLVVGSLIKNPGGGLAPIGGYIAGTEELIRQCSYRLSAPGLGQEVGANLGLLPHLFQGIFLAPTVTASALKTAIFAAWIYERLGFHTNPAAEEERHDIIQAVTLRSKEAMQAFCLGIQKASPVDSSATPYPIPMPGYADPVVSGGGTFVSGSSIELSSDGPLRDPFNIYFQGGLTWPHGHFGILKTVQCLKDAGLVSL